MSTDSAIVLLPAAADVTIEDDDCASNLHAELCLLFNISLRKVTVLKRIEYMNQFSARNSNLGIYG